MAHSHITHSRKHNSDGREVDGLGILAQQKGARAVVATLWCAVNDAGTGLLMQTFYKQGTTHVDIPKVEALLVAQLALLRGITDSNKAASTRTLIPTTGLLLS
jgi:CHAT domain-containing protein